MKRLFWVNLLLGVIFISCAHGGLEISPLDDYYNLARDLHTQKNYSLSESYYLKCLSLDENQEDCLYNLSLLYLETKKPDKAEPLLRKLLDRDNKNTLVLNCLGIVYSQKEEWESALLWYGKTLEQFPWDRGALYNSALVYKQISQVSKAKESLDIIWERERSYFIFQALYPYYLEQSEEERIRLITQTETEEDQERIALDKMLLDIYLEKSLFEEALPLLDSLYDSPLSRDARYLFKKGDILIHLYRIEEGLVSIRQAFQEGYHEEGEIKELADRLAPSTREVLLHLEELYFPQK